MDTVRKYTGWAIAGAFVVGLFIGLVVLGWWLWPVQWTDATPGQLSPEYQELYVNMVAELNSFQPDPAMVQQALGGWGGDEVACSMATETQDPSQRARLEAVAQDVNGTGCASFAGDVPAGDEEGGGGGIGSLLLPAFLLLLLLGLIVGGIFFVLSRRNTASADEDDLEPTYEEIPPGGGASAASVRAEPDVATVPIARFHTTYSRGHDAYDDSFSIENSNGEFLGECGVGIAESIGADSPRNVTALEIWLFDKSDIRTITKVVMSDHAFFDDALKAKLAPKGEPILSREMETIVLETASLIINAEITEMEYGASSALQPQSYFERITISLSAWAKEGNAAPQGTGVESDNLMDF